MNDQEQSINDIDDLDRAAEQAEKNAAAIMSEAEGQEECAAPEGEPGLLSGGGGGVSPRLPRDWALVQMKVPAAWAAHPARGAGITIAQLDTGYADHDVWKKTRLDTRAGYDFVDKKEDPKDPLVTGTLLHPGHGTAVASVAVARDEVQGVAPGANLVPMRCVTSVIIGRIGGGLAELTAGIERAIAQKARVISMSLGGYTFGREFWKACVKAINANIIVVAASGNKSWFTRIVANTTFPGGFTDVISVSASNPDGTPYADACWGPWGRMHYSAAENKLRAGGHVDIAAPGHGVWRAKRDHGDGGRTNVVEQSSGTSYATAHVAGVAALWLAKHYPNGYTGEHSLQRVFLSEIQRTCTVPSGWARHHGPGIINAERLIKEAPRFPLQTRSMERAR